jgi:hypothetical protein
MGKWLFIKKATHWYDERTYIGAYQIGWSGEGVKLNLYHHENRQTPIGHIEKKGDTYELAVYFDPDTDHLDNVADFNTVAAALIVAATLELR